MKTRSKPKLKLNHKTFYGVVEKSGSVFNNLIEVVTHDELYKTEASARESMIYIEKQCRDLGHKIKWKIVKVTIENVK